MTNIATQANCRSCGRAIIWVTTPDGKTMPVDARPTPIYVLRNEDERVQAYRVVEQYPSLAAERLYISHFASCPNSGSHSRG